MEISEVLDRLPLGVHVVRIVLAFGCTIAAIEVHFRIQRASKNIDRVVIGCTGVRFAAVDAGVKRTAGEIDRISIGIS